MLRFQLTKEYLRRYDDLRNDAYDKYHGYAFDGIWAIAKAMDRVIRGHPGSSSEKLLSDDVITAALNETNFLGVTVCVLLSWRNKHEK